MHGSEIEYILRIQWRSLHSDGAPYDEDYYYQGFVYKHHGRVNKSLFRPETVRNLDPTQRAEQGAASFVALSGLGKLALSNIRRPRPLMDINSGEVQNSARCIYVHYYTNMVATRCVVCDVCTAHVHRS